MRLIAIMIMKIMLRKARKNKRDCNNSIVTHAYDVLIQNYEDTIMFLKANKKI